MVNQYSAHTYIYIYSIIHNAHKNVNRCSQDLHMFLPNLFALYDYELVFIDHTPMKRSVDIWGLGVHFISDIQQQHRVHDSKITGKIEYFVMKYMWWHQMTSATRVRQNICIQAISHWLHMTLTGIALQWRHNGRECVSSHQSHDCFTQPFIQAQIKQNIKAPCHWPLSGEFSGDRWIIRTKGQ